MSKYTTELRYICEWEAGLDESKGYNDTAAIIESARPKIFSFSYPIFDSAYKPTLETKILRHFYTREICAETYGRWKLFLEAKMNEIMPYFNQLYASEALEFNPLYDADYYKEGENSGTETGTRTGERDYTNATTGEDTVTKERDESHTLSGTDTLTMNRTDKTTLSGTDTKTTEGTESEDTETQSRDLWSEWDLYSDTPQGGIAGIQGAEDPPSLVDNGYLTNARHVLHDGAGTEATGGSTKETNSETTTEYGKVSETKKTGTEATQYGKKNTIDIGDTETTEYGRTLTHDEDTSESSSKSKAGEYSDHIYGRLGGRTGAELLLEYRKTFLNIDMQIIASLEPLFMQLW